MSEDKNKDRDKRMAKRRPDHGKSISNTIQALEESDSDIIKLNNNKDEERKTVKNSTDPDPEPRLRPDIPVTWK